MSRRVHSKWSQCNHIQTNNSYLANKHTQQKEKEIIEKKQNIENNLHSY